MVWKATGRPDACDIIHKHVHGARTWKDVAKSELGVPGREELYRYLKTKPKLASFASLLVRTHEVNYWGSKTALFRRDGTRCLEVVGGRKLRGGVRASSRADSESAASTGGAIPQPPWARSSQRPR